MYIRIHTYMYIWVEGNPFLLHWNSPAQFLTLPLPSSTLWSPYITLLSPPPYTAKTLTYSPTSCSLPPSPRTSSTVSPTPNSYVCAGSVVANKTRSQLMTRYFILQVYSPTLIHTALTQSRSVSRSSALFPIPAPPLSILIHHPPCSTAHTLEMK